MNIPVVVDTAVIVPINACPLVDDADFKTIKSALAYNAAGLTLVWNFVTPAGVVTQTAVTPTNTGGVYDWQNKGNGMYAIEIPASGGASINNDTEGVGYFTGVATGVLPWRGPNILFAPSHVVNGLVTGSSNLQVQTVDLSVAGQADVEVAVDAALGNYAGAVGVAQQDTAVAITGAVSNVQTDVTAIKAKTDNLPADPADASDIMNALTVIDDFVDTEVAAVKAVTDKLDTALEQDGLVYRYTTNALEQAAGGGGGGSIYGESGSVTFTYTVYDTNGTTPLSGVAVYVSADLAGTQRSQTKITDDLGRVQFDLDPSTVYFWRSRHDRTFSDPDTEVVS